MLGKPLLLLMCLAWAGCESVSDATTRVRDKFAAREAGQTKIFTAPARPVYEAARVAANRMGYRFLRGGAAQGELAAVSGIGEGETHRGARQVTMDVKLRASEMAGGTEVTVKFTEIIEADSQNRAGVATGTPLRDTPQYEVFFRSVEQALAAAGFPAAPPAK